jgi:hypothetical protein
VGQLRNITLTASPELIEQARLRAALERTTLNAKFREWLDNYAHRRPTLEEYDRLMARLDYVEAGRKFTREEMNER